MLSLTAKVPFDDRFRQTASVDDLSQPLMLAFLREIGSALADDAATLSNEALGRQMNVVGGPNESPWPKNVGLLFFNEAPERFFPGTQIDVLWVCATVTIRPRSGTKWTRFCQFTPNARSGCGSGGRA